MGKQTQFSTVSLTTVSVSLLSLSLLRRRFLSIALSLLSLSLSLLQLFLPSSPFSGFSLFLSLSLSLAHRSHPSLAMFEKTLSDLIRGIRAHSDDEVNEHTTQSKKKSFFFRNRKTLLPSFSLVFLSFLPFFLPSFFRRPRIHIYSGYKRTPHTLVKKKKTWKKDGGFSGVLLLFFLYIFILFTTAFFL